MKIKKISSLYPSSSSFKADDNKILDWGAIKKYHRVGHLNTVAFSYRFGQVTLGI
jgi:hypothetical protein